MSGDWEQVPTGQLGKYVMMLPALEAQRALDVISQLRAGTGVMDAQVQRTYLRQLSAAANRGRRRRGVTPTVASLAELKIAVETLPAKEPDGQEEGGVL